MNITIVGSGNVGTALATSMTKAGHQVTITSRNSEHAQAAARQSGARPATDREAAIRGADVIVLAIPFADAADAVARDIEPLTAGKIVIDATNPLRPDGAGLATNGISGAEHFQELLPAATVVKAFNTLFASRQARPAATVDGFVAADDTSGKQQVMNLVQSMGFTPVDVGPLSAARYLEAMAFLNIGLNVANGWDWTSTWKLER